ncbi:transglycosylase family protein [Schaalia cardiffensis]|uniref:transglycosylase family protein n=1 Tax=Schaalia cardiffensis TaxID=181487 RepID=UPI002FCDE152
MNLTHPSRRTIISTASVLAFAMTATAGASVAASHHDVTIEVDGVSAPVSGFFTTVDDVLASAGVKLGAHDLLAPSGQSRVKDGETIVVRTATEYEVKIDGKPTTAWSTADSVDAVLDSLAEPGEVVLAAADRSNVRTQMPFASTRGPVEILVDGQTLKVDAEANDTADALLAKANVSLGQLDTLDFYAQGGQTSLKVQRIVRGSVTETSDIPFSSEEQEDDSMYVGEKKVTQEGVNGSTSSTYYRETINGETTINLLLSKTQTAPVNEIVSVGTKEKPQEALAPAASAAGQQSTVAASGDVWARLAQCESSGNPRAVNPAGYYGLYQFSIPTWRSVGGSGLPSDASVEEQTMRAQMLQARSGWGQWSCSYTIGIL